MELGITVAAIGATGAFIGTVVNAFMAYYAQKKLANNNDRNHKFAVKQANWTRSEKKLNSEKLSIDRKLTEFYRPLLAYLSESEAFYEKFKTGKPPLDEFRTLDYFLNPEHEYSTGKVVLKKEDFLILNNIFEKVKGVKTLIKEKEGLIDEANMSGPYVPGVGEHPNPQNYTTITMINNHYDFITMAYDWYKENLTKPADQREFPADLVSYRQWVYPRQLNKFVKDNIALLEKRKKTVEDELTKLFAVDLS